MENRELKRHKKRRSRRLLWVLLSVLLLIGAGVFALLKYNLFLPAPAAEESILPAAIPSPDPTPEPIQEAPRRETSLYTGRLRVDTVGERIYGELFVDYVNPSDETIYGLRFHLHPNTVAPDCLKITGAALNGTGAYFTVDGDILSVPLIMELAPGESCGLYLTFELALSKTGYGGGTAGWSLPCVMPVAAVNENGWLTDAQYGDITYSAVGEYRVLLEPAQPQHGFKVAECSLDVIQSPSGWYLTSEGAAGCDIIIR